MERARSETSEGEGRFCPPYSASPRGVVPRNKGSFSAGVRCFDIPLESLCGEVIYLSTTSVVFTLVRW